MEMPLIINNFLLFYGLISLSITIILFVFFINNYLKHKNIFYSTKDIEISFLQEALKESKNKYAALEAEKEEITKLIIRRLNQ